MAKYKISLGDFVEINAAIENNREIPLWTAWRIYGIFNYLKEGDNIIVSEELREEEHYNEPQN